MSGLCGALSSQYIDRELGCAPRLVHQFLKEACVRLRCVCHFHRSTSVVGRDDPLCNVRNVAGLSRRGRCPVVCACMCVACCHPCSSVLEKGCTLIPCESCGTRVMCRVRCHPCSSTLEKGCVLEPTFIDARKWATVDSFACRRRRRRSSSSSPALHR